MGDDDDDSDGSGDDYDDSHDSGSQAPAWPPWVTGKSPDKDIIIEEEKPTRSPPTFTGGSSNLHLAFYGSLLYYALPVIVIQIGRLVQQ